MATLDILCPIGTSLSKPPHSSTVLPQVTLPPLCNRWGICVDLSISLHCVKISELLQPLASPAHQKKVD